jgi:hypothetical protein
MFGSLFYSICLLVIVLLASYPLWLAHALARLLKKKNFKLKLKGYLFARSLSLMVQNLVHPCFEQIIVFASSLKLKRKDAK